MLSAKEGAATSPEALAPKIHRTGSYNQPVHLSMKLERARQISERLAQIPKLYRGIYDKAIRGRSRKAAMHSFCVECCGYQIAEVFLCTDLGCPLWPYRPKSRILHGVSESVRERSESKNCEQRELWGGQWVKKLIFHL